MLSSAQLQEYQEQGYLILRGAISEAHIARLETGVANNPPLDGTLDPNAPVYPNPGRYTLATQCLKDPDLAFIVEHPTIVDAVTDILAEPAKLTAYVIYDRTPNGAGLPAHHDYKRWRPVGSSMNWLFTIVPFCDFDDEVGPLYIAPGSHHLNRVKTGEGVCLEVDPAIKPNPHDFINPDLRRGDLLLMNMHLWHKADSNRSTQHRVGLFNKYAATSCPPATGYFLFDDDVFNALSDQGKRLIASHSSLPITHTRAVLVRTQTDTTEVYLQPADGLHQLPGGPISIEQAIPDWDRGNYIAALQQHLRHQVRIETPWLSYIGDYPEGDGLCRVYGYTLNNNGFPVTYPGTWVAISELAQHTLCHTWLEEAVQTWLDPNITRGKGLSQAQSRVDQFAY